MIAAVFAAVELAVSDRYGFQQGELYFLVASHHPAFGCVDQPPLAVLLARTTDILGVRPAAIRIIPALAGAAIVVLTARLAAVFGAARAGQVIAALSAVTTPVLLGACHNGNTTPYDLLAWTVVTLCAATTLLRRQPRWWLGAEPRLAAHPWLAAAHYGRRPAPAEHYRGGLRRGRAGTVRLRRGAGAPAAGRGPHPPVEGP